MLSAIIVCFSSYIIQAAHKRYVTVCCLNTIFVDMYCTWWYWHKFPVLKSTENFFSDILLEQFLMRLVDWSTQLERDENWRLLHYQLRGVIHWPLWIVQSRDTLDLCWHRYKLAALICLSRMEQKITHYAFYKRILQIQCSMHHKILLHNI